MKKLLQISALLAVCLFANSRAEAGPLTCAAFDAATYATSVISIAPTTANPTNAASASFAVTFGSAVTGVTASNFSVTTALPGVTVGTPTTSDNVTWTVPVNLPGTGDGTVALNMANAAGLSQGISNLPFTDQSVTVDHTAPQAAALYYHSNHPGNPDVAVTGDVVTLDFTSDEAIQSSTVVIGGHTVAASNVAGNAYAASYTMASGDTEGRIHFTAQFTDLAGNTGPLYNDLSAGDDIEFDNTPPAITSTPVMAAASDSGTPGDNITNVTTPIFTGTAEPEATVTLYDNGGTTPVGSAIATGGNWSISSSTLSEGPHTITAKAADAAGNVSSPSTGLVITINTALPTATISPVAAVEETSNSFDINYSNLTGDPNLYSVSVAATNQMPGFSVVSNFSLHPNTITVDMPNTSAGTYNFVLSFRNQAAGNSSADIPFSLTVNAPPPPATVTLGGTLNAFSSCVGSTSAEQSFKVSGTNLTADVIIDAPAGFEISKTTGTSFASQLTFAQTAGVVGLQDVFVRLAASATGTPAGDITVKSTGVTDQAEPVTGTVNNIPTISVGAVTPVATTATTFALPYSGVPSGNYIYFISTGARVMAGFSTVNGFTLVPNVSVNLPATLAPGTYDFNLTIENTATTCTSVVVPFTLTVLGTDANLVSLTTTATGFTPTFDPATTTGYMANVLNTTANTTVTPTAADLNSIIRVRVNGSSYAVVLSGNSSEPLPLNIGANAIDLQVTSQDGANIKTYTLTVNRAGTGSALLTSLTYNPPLTISKVPGTHDFDYKATIYAAVLTIKVKPVTQDPFATVTVNGQAVASGSESDPIALAVGPTVITTIVTGSDGVSTKSYSITITRQPNALLATLAYSPPSLRKTKVAGSNYVDYVASVAPDVAFTTVTPVTQDPTSKVTVNGQTVASGGTSDPIALAIGNTTVTTVVTAVDGITTRTYSIVITRQADASLSSLAYSPALTTAIRVSGSHNYDYVATVNKISAISVIPATEDPAATVTVNGVPVTSGTASNPIALAIGPNVIDIVVTAVNGTTIKSYSVTITRQVNALLSQLTLSPLIKKNKVSGGDYADYTSMVANSVSSVTVSPVTQDATSTVTVNGTPVVSGAISNPIALSVGDNTISTTVTAVDGTTTNTYSVVITRLAPPPAIMAYNQPKDATYVNADIVVHQNVSPNGDGRGDAMQIEGITAYPDNKLQIMNRSGNLVYEAKGYDNATKLFDGHANNGKLQQAGTYFYSLEYKVGTETRRKTGYLVLKY